MKNLIHPLVVFLTLFLPNNLRAYIVDRILSKSGRSATGKTVRSGIFAAVFRNPGKAGLLLLLLIGFHPAEAQQIVSITEGKYTYRPVVRNNRVLWFENRELNETVGRVSLYLYENGQSRLITNDASVLFPGWPDLDDDGNVAFMKNIGQSHEVFLYNARTFQETRITNNPAIRGSAINMGLGNDKTYTGYVRIHGGDIVFKDRLGQIYLYQRKTESVRPITNAPAQAANLGDDDAEKGATGVAVPGGAHVKYFEFDGKHIVWMHEDRGSGNNSKVSIYMATAAEGFVPKLITSFDAWVPNDKGVVPGKLWNPFFRACNGKIIWQYYLPSQPPKLPAGVKLPGLLKDYGADMDDVRVGFFDGKVREISSGTAVTFQSVRIENGRAIWSQIRKEGEGKNVKKFQEVISFGSGGQRTVASYPEPPKQAKTGDVFWDGILDVEIVGEDVFWVMGQTECFQQFQMPVTNESYCMYRATDKVGFFRERSGDFFPFLLTDRQNFAGGGEIDRGLYAFFSASGPLNRDISAVPVVGGMQNSSDNFLTVSDRKQPDQKKWRVDEPQRKQITDAFSIDFDFLPGCSEAAGELKEITLESVTLDVSAEISPTARLEDIKSVALYADENQNNRLDAGDKLLGKRNGPVPAETIFVFSGGGIRIEQNKPKHFLVEMEIVEEVCPCGKYTVEVSGEKLGVKNTGGAISAGGRSVGSVIMPEAEKKEVRGDEQAGLPGQKLPENLVIVYKNFPVRCGRVKFRITTQPPERGAAIISSQGETTDEVILDLTQTGKDAMAEIGFRLGNSDGLYTVRASIVMPGEIVCDNEDHIFGEHAGKMVVRLIDMNDPEYFTAVPDRSNPDFDTWKATMTADTEKLAVGGEGREGALADGASMLLVRIKLVGFRDPPPGDINVSIAGDQHIGHLSRGLGETIPAYDGGSALSVRWVKTGAGVFGFALYTPPRNFGYVTAPRRNVRLKAVYALEGAPEPLVSEQDLTLMKPPVAFVHGLWSGPETWGDPFALHTSQYEVHFIDYSSLSSLSFAELGAELQLGIRNIVRKLRQRKIAATSVNVVGHSMGGLVARQHFADDHGRKFFRRDNFGKGDIYKLITLGTPHYGSPLAWLLVTLRDRQFSPVQALARRRQIDIESGAVDALCPGSRDLQGLGATHIPTHTVRAWIYDSKTDVLSSGDSLEKLLFEMTRVIKDPKSIKKATPGGFVVECLKHAGVATGQVLLSRLYGADRTDILVTLESQGGGIAQGANNVFDGTIHFDTGYDLSPFLRSETTSELTAAHIFDTLNRDYDAIDYFAPKMPAPIVADPGIACSQRR